MEIISFKPIYARHFKDLNIAWLQTYFYVEPFDEEVLSNPDTYIIYPGGYIFFLKIDSHIVGTVALMKSGKGIYELTKMAVDPTFQGQGLGQKLMEHCISFGKANAFSKLFLYSNTILENAIYIYRKWGFVEIPQEKDVVYKRSNIKMELVL